MSDTIDQDRNTLYVIVLRTFCVLTLSLGIPSHFNYPCKNVFMTDSLLNQKCLDLRAVYEEKTMQPKGCASVFLFLGNALMKKSSLGSDLNLFGK